MLEAVFITIVGLIILWKFSNTEDGQKPILENKKVENDGFNLLGTLLSVGLILFFSFGALVGGIESDALSFVSFSIALGSLGLLLFFNGIMPRLSIIIFIACVVGGFVVGGMVGVI